MSLLDLFRRHQRVPAAEAPPHSEPQPKTIELCLEDDAWARARKIWRLLGFVNDCGMTGQMAEYLSCYRDLDFAAGRDSAQGTEARRAETPKEAPGAKRRWPGRRSRCAMNLMKDDLARAAHAVYEARNAEWKPAAIHILLAYHRSRVASPEEVDAVARAIDPWAWEPDAVAQELRMGGGMCERRAVFRERSIDKARAALAASDAYRVKELEQLSEAPSEPTPEQKERT